MRLFVVYGGKNRNEREVAEMANKKGSRQLTWTDRISIEALKKAGHSVIEIAEQLGVHRSTIYNELKRGNICTEIVTIQKH